MITSEDIKTSSVPVEGGESYARATLCLDCVVAQTRIEWESAGRIAKAKILEWLYGELSENAARALHMAHQNFSDRHAVAAIEKLLRPIIEATEVK